MAIDNHLVLINEEYKKVTLCNAELKDICNLLISISECDDAEYEMHNYDLRLSTIKRRLKVL
jgi:hypothetical protein